MNELLVRWMLGVSEVGSRICRVGRVTMFVTNY